MLYNVGGGFDLEILADDTVMIIHGSSREQVLEAANSLQQLN